MISSSYRADWFGASDVNYIIGNKETKSFEKWWLEKIGLNRNDFLNEAMAAGTHYEHRILDSLHIEEKDRQILIPDLRLRVNLDGNTEDTVYEVKTYKKEPFKLPIRYKRQVWVQMFASGLNKANIVCYRLTEDDYRNFFNEIDKNRLTIYPIEPNPQWIERTFLPELRYLIECYKEGRLPRNRS